MNTRPDNVHPVHDRSRTPLRATHPQRNSLTQPPLVLDDWQYRRLRQRLLGRGPADTNRAAAPTAEPPSGGFSI